jgi:hypothetical protein
MKTLIIPYNLSEVRFLINLIKSDKKLSYLEMSEEKISFFDSNCEFLKSYPNFLKDSPNGEQVEVVYLLRYLVNLEKVVKEQVTDLIAIKSLKDCGESIWTMCQQISNNSLQVCGKNILKEIDHLIWKSE